MNVLVLAEFDSLGLKEETSRTIRAAMMFSKPVDVLVVGYQCNNIAQQVSKMEGIRHVFYLDNKAFLDPLPEILSDLLYKMIKGMIGDGAIEQYSHLLISSGSEGKNIIPRLAAMLDVEPVSDVVAINSEQSFVRPIYAGNVLETLITTDSITLLTIRTTAFEPVNTNGDADIITFEAENVLSVSKKRVDRIQTDLSRPKLRGAKIIVSGGRGLATKENFEKLIFPLADKLNAAVGASRAAVDMGFVGNSFQVGQTGAIVSPNLYIAVGISGAIQHQAGIKDAGIIVAINKDPNAMIFKVADYGLVADLFDVVPELIEQL